MNIDKLIYDALALRRAVTLPGVGTLEVKHLGARKISETRIAPPKNVVALYPDDVPGAESVIAMIAAGGVDQHDAEALYGEWIEAARKEDGSLSIEGVGSVREGKLAIAEELHAVLNPAGEKIVTMETKKRSIPLWAWVIMGFIAAALVVCAVVCYKNGLPCLGRKAAPVTETHIAAPAPDADSLAAARDDAARAVPAAPRFHVIAGAFAIESNADNFIATLKRDYPELTPEKVVNPANGYNMVSIYQAPTEREARGKMNLYWDVDLNLWIYPQE